MARGGFVRAGCWSWLALLILGVLVAGLPNTASGVDLLLRWTVPPEPDVIGYRLYLGSASRLYDTRLDLDLLRATTVGGVAGYVLALPPPGAFFVAVTAVSQAGLESEYSNERLIPAFSGTLPSAVGGPDRVGVAGYPIAIGAPPGDAVTTLWWQVGGPAQIAFADPTASETLVTAPVPGTYVVQLIAADVDGFAVRDEVTLTILAEPPSTLPLRTPTETPTGTPTPTVTRAATATPTPTASPSSTAATPAVFGDVEYFGTGIPVAGVTVEVLTPDDPVESPKRVVQTVADGRFTIADLPRGVWEVQPRADLSPMDAVTALDAAFVLQAVNGLRPVSAAQRVACDASGNGTLSALDASLILQRAVGLRASLPAEEACGTGWVFDPLLDEAGSAGRAVEVNSTRCRSGAFIADAGRVPLGPLRFRAITLGDCTGNWSSGPVGTAAARMPPEVVLDTRRADRGHSVVSMTLRSDQPLYGLAAELRTPARLLRVRLRNASPGATVVAGDAGAGRIWVAAAGAVPLGGDGQAGVDILFEAETLPDVEVIWIRVNEDPPHWETVD